MIVQPRDLAILREIRRLMRVADREQVKSPAASARRPGSTPGCLPSRARDSSADSFSGPARDEKRSMRFRRKARG